MTEPSEGHHLAIVSALLAQALNHLPTADGDGSEDEGEHEAAPMAIGQAVRLKRSGRRGVVTAAVVPPRSGRSLLVVWDSGFDFSLVAPREIEADASDAVVPVRLFEADLSGV